MGFSTENRISDGRHMEDFQGLPVLLGLMISMYLIYLLVNDFQTLALGHF